MPRLLNDQIQYIDLNRHLVSGYSYAFRVHYHEPMIHNVAVFYPPVFFFLGILTHPQSMNVSLNGFAMFNCTVIASFISWEIDGVLIDSDLRDTGFDDSAPVMTLNLTQDLRSTSLRVLGSPDSNNVSITCVAFNPITLTVFDVITSEPALVHVQGKFVRYMFRIHLLRNYYININWDEPE